MTVVVTGASGHIGANLVRALLAEGRAVRAVVHGDQRLLSDMDVECVKGDVREPASLADAFRGAEIVYHLAAIISIDGEQGGRVAAVNVQGSANAAQAALDAGVKRMVHFSSVGAFSQAPLDEVLDETRARATAPRHTAYDRSKAAGEAEVRKVSANGLDCVIVHPTGVVGPYDAEPSRMGSVFLDLYNRRLPALINGGFDWVDVRDVVAGAMAAEERGRSGESYSLGGHWHSVSEIAEMAESVTGVRRPRLVSPMWLARVGVPFVGIWNRLSGQPPLYTSDSLEALRANRTISHEKASRELGYTPRPIEETVRDTYAWFQETGKIPELTHAS